MKVNEKLRLRVIDKKVSQIMSSISNNHTETERKLETVEELKREVQELRKEVKCLNGMVFTLLKHIAMEETE